MSGKFVPVSNWQIFEKRSKGGGKYGKYVDEPVVIITAGNELVMSKLCYEMIGSPEYVRFLTDGNKRIGIVGSSEDDLNSYKLSPRRENGLILAHANLLIKEYFGEQKRPRVFRAEMDGDILVVPINQMPSII